MNKDLEKTLLETIARHSAMIENIGDVIAIVDAVGKAIYHSPNIEKWFGWKPEDLVGKNGFEFIHPEDVEIVQKELTDILEKENTKTVEYRFKCKSGRYKWIEVTASNRITDPSIAGVLLNYHDITVRKQAERALRESEIKYSGLFNSIRDAILVANTDREIIECNHAFSDLFEYSLNDIKNKKTITVYENEEQHIELGQALKRHTGNASSFLYTVNYKKKSGAVFAGETNIFYLKDGNGDITGFIGLIRDVTERKAAEEVMRKMLHSLKQAETIADLGYFERNWQSGKGFWSEGFYRLLGVSSDNVDSTHDEFMTYVHAEDRERVTEHIREALAKRLEMDVEFRLVRADGSEVIVHCVGRNFYDEQGKPLSTIGTFQNITERKKMEEEKLTILAQLQQSQKLESIGTLASGVAHEINNPLMGMINYADIIRDGLEDVQLKEYAGNIMEEGKRIAEIVQNLLVFARQGTQSYSSASIADIINSSHVLTAATLQKNQIIYIQDIPDGLPPIKCRSQQIQQVILNLLNNAVFALNSKYDGYHENKIIKIIVKPIMRDNVHWIRTTVEDHGTGIEDDIIDRIFDPFFSTKGRIYGTGLGLSISYGIVDEHRGVLSVETNFGEFTRFHMDLRVDDGWMQEGWE